MADDFKPGDAVTWEYAGAEVKGKIVKKLTSPTDIKGHHVAASKENPEFLVRSDGSGAEAAHKPGSLTRL